MKSYLKINKIVILLFSLFFLLKCRTDTIIKPKDGLKTYSISGYLSSRKDQLSFDIKIQVKLLEKFYELRGFDTLLGKERFVLQYKGNRWLIKDQETRGEFYIIDTRKNLAGVLPPPEIFDYVAFLQGKIPTLKNAEPVRSGNKIIYNKKPFRQELNFHPEKGYISEMVFFKNNKKVYKMVYKNYLIAGKRVFPKILNIYDYQSRRKIVWWLSKIKLKESK